MEPTPTPTPNLCQPINAADVQRLYEQMLPRSTWPPLDFRPAGRYRPERRPVPRPSAASLIDGAPEPPEAALHQVQQQLQEDEQAWFTRLLVESLQLAGESEASADTLPDYAGRLSMRRYPEGVLIVALDSKPIGEGPGVTRGRVLFGVGEPLVQVGPGPLQITRPLLTWQQALAFELGKVKFPDEPEPAPEPQPYFDRFHYGNQPAKIDVESLYRAPPA
jgi:hypothetical protein